MEKAVELARRQRAEIDSGEEIDIYLRGGVYYLQNTVVLNSLEGVTPLKISAYKNEKVRLTGGVDIPLSAMEPAATDFTDRIIDKSVLSEKILQYDLKKSGINEYGEISRRGFRISANQTAQAEISLNGETQQLAAWPNEDFVSFTGSDNPGTRRAPDSTSPEKANVTDGCSFTVDFDRPSLWNDPENVWLSGVVADNFFNDYYPLERFDADTKTVYLREGAVKTGYSKPFYRFENIPEELDAPGEYYIDRSSGMLYFYPPEGAEQSDVLTVAMTKEDLIRVENSNDITFENLTFDNGRKSAIAGTDTTGITVKNCDIHCFGAHGIRLDKTVRARIDSCRIHDVGQNGVMLTGGDYVNITFSENVIYNNDIYRFARLERCYYAGVYIGYQSVGAAVERNHIHDAPHAGLIYYGVNHRIAGNEIDNVVTECHDMGAVYANISEFPWERGNVIQGNYFHDLGQRIFNGQRQMNIYAVYNDNNGCGLAVTENLFCNIGTERSNSVCGVRAEGTYNKVNHNMFVDCSGTYKAMGASYDANLTYQDDDTIGGRKVADLKVLLAQRLPIYGKQFPELERFFEEHPRAVQSNEFLGNAVVNISGFMSEIDTDRNSAGFRGTAQLVNAQSNRLGGAECKEWFQDYDNEDFSLTDAALGELVDFPKMQMSDFGVIK